MKKLVVVDGSGFIYRAFYSLPPLTRSDGTPIGAVYGFTNILISMLTNNSMDYFAIILDKTKKTFRHDIYPQYKQNRRETPPELIPQFKIIREVCESFNVPYIEEDNYEADDLIASYTNLALNNGFCVKIVSGDKDLVQLIRENVELYDPLKAKDITIDEVLNKYGIKPSQMVDFLALCGDSADNIPGVSSIGPKTAAKLLNEFGDLESIIKNVSEIKTKKKFHEKIIAEQENARLSKILAQINENAPCTIELEMLKIQELDVEKARAFLEEQEFNSLIQKLNGIKHKKVSKEYSSWNEINELAKKEKIVFISDHSIKTNNGQEVLINRTNPEPELIGLLEDSSVLKLTNDAKKLMHVDNKLSNFEDLSMMAFLVNGKDSSFSLTHSSYDALLKKLEHCRQKDVYYNIEKPLIKILYDIEKIGFKVNVNKLNRLTEFFDKLLKTIKDNIFIISGKEINLDSPKQVSDLLFNHLNIKYFKKGKKSGTPSTGQMVLEELEREGYEIASHILQWRQISKLRSTYTTALVPKISPVTGRIHTTLNTTNTVTGRLSSSYPNLQNIPVKTNIGMKIREAFVADEGKALISMDYSQIELRVLAHLSKCAPLLHAFHEELDIHTITASKLFHVPLEDVTPDLRRKAKAINFGIIYGMTSFGISKRINLTAKESNAFIAQYFAQYPEVKEYMNSAITAAYDHGYLETILGRRCFIPNISSSNFQLRKFAERQAINAPIQGSSADIMKVAMINISKETSITAKIIMQIHDELIFEIEENKAQEQAQLIQKVMESVGLIDCHLKVNISIGKNWGEL